MLNDAFRTKTLLARRAGTHRKRKDPVAKVLGKWFVRMRERIFAVMNRVGSISRIPTWSFKGAQRWLHRSGGARKGPR